MILFMVLLLIMKRSTETAGINCLTGYSAAKSGGPSDGAAQRAGLRHVPQPEKG
ncbi:hypothetical protein NBRC116602_00680 [Hyphomicrobiales bacterium 4NK60-0047b]